MFTIYYVICVIYCFYQLIKKYNRNNSPGLIGETPGLDAIMVLVMAWVLAPVDVAITWIKRIREAEEAKRRQEDKTSFQRKRDLLRD